MLLIKKVLGPLNDPEKIWAMQDYCSIMHRLDRQHTLFYPVFFNEFGDTELTLTEYFKTDAGRWWCNSPKEVEMVQYWVKWTSLLRMATLRNQCTIRKLPLMRADDSKVVEGLLNRVRHALCHINAFQVRVFVAFLYKMCSIQEIVNAGKGQRMYHKTLREDKHMAWAEPFQMVLHYYDSRGEPDKFQVKLAWTWPCFAPPSAMQFLMRRLKISKRRCQWTNHVRMGLQHFEEAQGEKLSWWGFYQNSERYCPLEQRATQAQVKAHRKKRKEAGLS